MGSQRPMQISSPISSSHTGHSAPDGTVSTGKSAEWDKLSEALNSKLKEMGSQALSEAEVKYLMSRVSKRGPHSNAISSNPTPSQHANNKTSQPTQGQQQTRGHADTKTWAQTKPSPAGPKRGNRQTLIVKGEIMQEQYEMYKERCMKLEAVADKARELNKRVKQLEQDLRAKDELSRKLAAAIKQEREDHATTKDKLVRMAERAKQILSNASDEHAKQELRSDLAQKGASSQELNEVRAKHKQELSRVTDELERERRMRQELEERMGDMNLKLEDEIAQSEVLKDTCAEQKVLIERLENGLAMAMDQLDYLNSQEALGGGGNGGGGGYSGGGYAPQDDVGEDDIPMSLLGDIDEEALDDPEMLKLLAEVLINKRQSIADLGDLGDLFQKMEV